MMRFFKPPPIDKIDILNQLYPTCEHAGSGSSNLRKQNAFLQEIEETCELISSLMKPVGTTRILNQKELENWPEFKNKSIIAIAAATIGPQFDLHLAALKQGSSDLKSLLWHTAGSAAVEKICDTIENSIQLEFRKRNLVPSRRFSPGYGDFPLDRQKLFFRFLPCGEIGIKLTSGLMMKPIKSVTFAVVEKKYEDLFRVKNPCISCGVINCSQRVLK